MITKRLLQLLFTLLLIALLAIVGLVLFVDPNRYKTVIIQKVESTYDRTLAITGEISWRFWPRLGLTINGVELGQAPGFTQENNNVFAKVGAASIYISIAPLLNKQIEIDKLSIQDAHIYLARLANGSTNWHDLSQKTTTATTPNAQPSAHTPDHLDWAISALSVENSFILWKDAQKKQTIGVSIKELNTALQMAQTNPLDAVFAVDLQPQNIQLTGDLQSHYYLDTHNKLYRAEKGKIKVQAQGVDGLQPNQAIHASFDKWQLDLKQAQLQVDNLQANLFDGELFINAKAENIYKKPRLAGTLALKNINPRQLAQALGQELNLADPQVATQLNLEATFKNTADGFIMQPFSAQLDDTHITGQLSANHSISDLSFNFKVNRINLDHYLPRKTNASSTQQTTAATNKKSTTSNHAYNKITAHGDLQIETLQFANIKLQALTIQLKSQNGMIHIAPLKAQLYGGDLNQTVVLNMQKSTPTWNIKTQLNNINVGALLQDLAKSNKFTGRLHVDSQLNTAGLSSKTLLQNLNGTAAFNIDQGVLNGVDLSYWLEVGQSMLLSASNLKTLAITTAEAAVGKTDTQHTTFKDMSGSFQITQGIAQNNDLVLYNDSFYTAGKGKIDLSKQYMDYILQISSVKQNAGHYAAYGVKIPLTLKGPLAAPHIGIDPNGIQTLLLESIQNGLTNTLQDALGVPKDVIGTEQAIVNTVTGSNTQKNTQTNGNANSSAPEQIIKDTLKGLLGK